jgi:hypothetical protein
MAGMARYNPCSVRDLMDWIERVVHHTLAKAPFSLDDAALLPAAGACSACPKRTGAAPDLYTDLDAKRDCCTDPECWDRKVKSHVTAVTRENPALAKLSDEHYGRPPENGALTRMQWTSAGIS